MSAAPRDILERTLAATTLDLPTAATITFLAAAVKSPEWIPDGARAMCDAGVGVDAALEIGLQTALFAGVPRAINALASLHETYAVVGEHRDDDPIETDPSRLLESGRDLFERIYATNTELVLTELRRLHPALEGFVLRYAYGAILARKALDARTRELAAVAALVVSGDFKQLSSHVRGALNCGASAAEVRATLPLISEMTTAAALERAAAVIAKVLPSPVE